MTRHLFIATSIAFIMAGISISASFNDRAIDWSLTTVFASCIWVVTFILSLVVKSYLDHVHKTIFNDGYQAYQCGVPSSANPYLDVTQRLLWYEGWKTACNHRHRQQMRYHESRSRDGYENK